MNPVDLASESVSWKKKVSAEGDFYPTMLAPVLALAPPFHFPIQNGATESGQSLDSRGPLA